MSDSDDNEILQRPNREEPARQTEQFSDIFEKDSDLRRAATRASRRDVSRPDGYTETAPPQPKMAPPPPEAQRQEPETIPEVRSDTIYARVTSAGLRAAGSALRYDVPKGFFGILLESRDARPKLMLSGERASGEFALHLFREGTINLSQSLRELPTADGFKAAAEVLYSVRLPGTAMQSLDAFVSGVVEGRQHLSKPILQQRYARMLADLVGQRVRELDAATIEADGLGPNAAEAIEEEISDRLARLPAAPGLEFLGVAGVEATVPDYQHHLEKQAVLERRRREEEARAAEEAEKAAREAERSAKEATRKAELDAQLRAIAEKEVLGRELTREELGLLLDSARHRRTIERLGQEKEQLERSRELDRLQQLVREDHLSSEAALSKLETERTLELDKAVLSEYVALVGQARARLEDDHLVVHVMRLQDEKLRASLLTQLMLKDAAKTMSPEAFEKYCEVLKESARLPAADSSKESSSEPTSTRQSQVEAVPERSNPVPEPEAAPAEAPAVPVRGQQVTRPGAAPLTEQSSQTQVGGIAAARVRCLAALRNSEDDKAGQAHWVLLAGGRRVFFCELLGGGRSTAVGTLLSIEDGPLGSLRSLRLFEIDGQRRLVAGARRGLYAHDPSNGQFLPYPIEGAFNPTFGVNAVVPFRGKFYATHSEYGLLRWTIAAPRNPANLLLRDITKAHASSRSLFVDADTWPTFACGTTIVAVKHDFVPGLAALYEKSHSPIVSVLPLRLSNELGDGFFYAVCEDGTVIRWHIKMPNNPEPVWQMGVNCTDASPTADGSGFVLCGGEPWVRVFDAQQRMVATYYAPLPIRCAREAGGHLLGLSDDRTLLYVWDSMGDGKPVAEVPLPEPCLDLIAF